MKFPLYAISRCALFSEKCFKLKFLAGKILPDATDPQINFLLGRFILKSGINAKNDQMVTLKQLWTLL